MSSHGSALIDMYGKCGNLEDARNVFDKLPKKNLVTWSAIIAAHARLGHGQEALRLVKKMQDAGIEPNNFLFPSILKACSSIASLEEGKWIHALIVKTGNESDVYVGSTLIDMYAKCGNLKDACKIFHKLPKGRVLTWSVMIDGFTQHGYGKEALQLFKKMKEEGVEPDNITFASILKACSGTAALDQAKLIHACIYDSDFEPDVCVWNTVIDIYAKFGNLEDARIVFDNLVNGDAVSWSTLIFAYAQHGCGDEAIQLFYLMQKERMKPTNVTFISILKACSSISASEKGKLIHAFLINCGQESDVYVGSALIDMYAKCGNLTDAQSLLQKLPNDNIVIWSALIGGCGQHSTYELALQYFECMKHAGLKPNDVTYSCLLSSCSHVVRLEEACHHFRSIIEHYDIMPTIDHYNCMVDLLGCAGYLNNAEDLLWSIPLKPNVMSWTSLLNYCKIHGNVELGRQCFDHLIKMDQSNASGYVLMSNMYSGTGMWEDVSKIEELRKYACAWKMPGKAFIEVDHKFQGFNVGDHHHPEATRVFAKLNGLFVQLKEEGHVPQVDLYVNLILDNGKEDGLYGQ